MPLSKPSPREHIHTRDIQCKGYRRADGLWDIEGSIMDTKTYSFDNVDRGGVGAGEAIHHMLIRLTVDEDMVVQSAEASTEASPYTICGDITPAFEGMKGVKIGPGWRKEVTRVMGGTGGCTHLRDLLMGPLAVTAYQTIVPARRKRMTGASDGKKPSVIGTCYAYAPTVLSSNGNGLNSLKAEGRQSAAPDAAMAAGGSKDLACPALSAPFSCAAVRK